MTAYISGLKSECSANAGTEPKPTPDLQTRLVAWHRSVPAVSRVRPYSMLELEQALGTQGRYLSPVLLNLGWERRRKWSTKQQYLRYWVPPERGK